ncbi:hypothetical protein HPB52_010879 [Rhipicephalus sanguineus]|uniref:Uncharacterized protein n=1 Tax=Rhipicephalus sanguineus TaxID=34632 RepID=A0A9D4PVJ1_RHISA|nr:hypothetical protein HPB52_010879 [Rhipicephalus sanguineus]
MNVTGHCSSAPACMESVLGNAQGINGNLIDRQDDCTPDARPASGFRSQARITSQGPGDPPTGHLRAVPQVNSWGGMTDPQHLPPSPFFPELSALRKQNALLQRQIAAFTKQVAALELQQQKPVGPPTATPVVEPAAPHPSPPRTHSFPRTRRRLLLQLRGYLIILPIDQTLRLEDRQKRAHLLFRQYRGSLPAVIALQEAGPNPIFPGYCSYIGGTTTNLLAHKSYTAVQVDLDLDLSYDYCMISVLSQKSGAPSIHIFNVYCLPHLQRVTFAELSYRALQAAAWQPLVVVGDFNALRRH